MTAHLTDEEYAIALEVEWRARQAAQRDEMARVHALRESAGEGNAHVEYQHDPVGWANDKLGVPEHTLRWSLNPGYDDHRWDGTPDPIATAFDAIADGHDAAIESGTGTGKSFGVAVLILWFLACWKNAQVYTFALNEDQLKLYIWKNIHELWPRFAAWFPLAEMTSLTIRMRGGIDDTWGAHGRPVQVRAGETIATRAAGMHGEDMLLVYEEAAAMDWAIIEAGRQTCTRPHNVRIFIGNPNHQLDSLHRVSQQAGVVAIRASALDHPNLVSGNPDTVPGTISQEKLDLRRADYGEESPVYQSRVRGISPEQATDALIRVEWLRHAAIRYQVRKKLGALPVRVTGKGVDVANSEHGDHAAIVDFADNVCTRCDSFPCPDSNVLGAQVVADAKKQELPASRIGVDAIGVGAGTVNEARRLGWIVQALYAGGNPMKMMEKAEDGRLVEWSPDVNVFENLRGQMYWQARVDLQNGGLDAPEDRELWEELTVMTYNDESKKVKVMKKDEVKKLIGRSPNKADAFVMANWVRKRSVEPPKPQLRPNQSAGYDYVNQRPKPKPSAEDEVTKLLQSAAPNATASRYSVPSRRER